MTSANLLTKTSRPTLLCWTSPKAFDTVPHQKLLYKLKQYGIKGPLHKWLANFLTQRQMRVVIDDQFSREASRGLWGTPGHFAWPPVVPVPYQRSSQCCLITMIIFSTGRFTLTKTTSSCTEQDLLCSTVGWRYGQDSRG